MQHMWLKHQDSPVSTTPTREGRYDLDGFTGIYWRPSSHAPFFSSWQGWQPWRPVHSHSPGLDPPVSQHSATAAPHGTSLCESMCVNEGPGLLLVHLKVCMWELLHSILITWLQIEFKRFQNQHWEQLQELYSWLCLLHLSHLTGVSQLICWPKKSPGLDTLKATRVHVAFLWDVLLNHHSQHEEELRWSHSRNLAW